MNNLICMWLFCAANTFSDPKYKDQSLTICNNVYTIHPSIITSHGKNSYILRIERKGFQTRMLNIGIIKNQDSRSAILKALSDSLHKVDLFPSCADNWENDFTHIDVLIENLIKDLFPNSHIEMVERIINDNNKLRLYKESTGNIYKIAIETTSGSTPLVGYDIKTKSYQIDISKISTSIKDHFDYFIDLYFQISMTAVKPTLYLYFDNFTKSYQIIVSNDEHCGTRTSHFLDPSVVKKLSTVTVNNLKVDSRTPDLLKIVDPSSTDIKKTKVEPSFHEQ